MKVKPGQKIQRGELLGYVGSTGTSTAPHVHYEIIKGENKINPPPRRTIDRVYAGNRPRGAL